MKKTKQKFGKQKAEITMTGLAWLDAIWALSPKADLIRKEFEKHLRGMVLKRKIGNQKGN